MSNDKAVSEHYLHGDLLNAIQVAVTKLGKTVDSVTIEDLAPVDEFHVGGRLATENFLRQFKFSERDHILDVGCGLGGAARFVVSKYNNHVTGIDLTQEYVETGNALCAWVKLDRNITLQQGSALSMPFQDRIFDGGYMMHVGMNIEDKAQLFNEIYRVLRPGSFFGVYDIMRHKDCELAYPVPWAKNEGTSKLATLVMYQEALADAGFEVVKEKNRRDFALAIFNQQRAQTEANGGPPPLGLHTLMQESTAEKIQNMIANIANDYIVPVEVLAKKI
jgi:ubiquinone/menaquinone biosynthesis C-methylase UbiE